MENTNVFKIGKYLKPFKWQIFLYVLLTAIASVFNVFYAIAIARIMEFVAILDYSKSILVVVVVIIITITQNIFYQILNYLYFKYSSKIMQKLNSDLAKQAFKLNSRTFANHDTGTFVQRIVEDPREVVDALATLVDYAFELISAIVMFVYISTLNIYISLIFLAVIIIAGVLEYVRVKTRRKNKVNVKVKGDLVHSFTTEIVRSEKDIKALGLEKKLSEVSDKYYYENRRARYKMNMVNTTLERIRNVVIGVGSLLPLILGVVLLDRSLLTLSAFTVVYANRTSLWGIISNIGILANYWVTMSVSGYRMKALFDEAEFETEKFGDVAISDVKGEIEFKNVACSFKDYNYDYVSKKEKGKFFKKKVMVKNKRLVSQNQVFKNLNFKIEPNTTVAFVGKSGSGKSTILNLISKMVEADSGEVLIDGVNIQSLNKETIRREISLVNQFPYIFDMSIKDNLLLANEKATDAEIDEVIEKVSLTEFINFLPKGLNTRVGESGVRLSGGQKQRLAIARALLRNSSILLFDESTSSLDNFAQGDIKKTIDNLKGKSTIIIVAHRLSTIKDVDKIYFLDDGKVSDSGTFEELFKRNKKFNTMFMAENM